jgi:hypothetical protein
VITYGQGADFWGSFIDVDGGSTLISQALVAAPGTNGLFPIDDAGTYATVATSGSNKQPVIATFAPSTPVNLITAFSAAANMSNLALAQNVSSPTEFIATMNDASSCYAFPCTLVKCFVCTNPEQHTTCDGARAAARGASHATAWRQTGWNILSVDQYAVGSVDPGTGTFSIVATKSDYPIVRISGGALFVARYDGTAAPNSDQYPTSIGTITSLDVVADDPTTAGFAVALVAGNSVYFMHVCN